MQNLKSIKLLKWAAGLDQGEREAIILMNELYADVLLMDEVKGWTVSFQMGFKIMGAIGVFMAAYGENELTVNEITGCVEGLQNA